MVRRNGPWSEVARKVRVLGVRSANRGSISVHTVVRMCGYRDGIFAGVWRRSGVVSFGYSWGSVSVSVSW